MFLLVFLPSYHFAGCGVELAVAGFFPFFFAYDSPDDHEESLVFVDDASKLGVVVLLVDVDDLVAVPYLILREGFRASAVPPCDLRASINSSNVGACV